MTLEPGTPCRRCKQNAAIYISRKEPFCKECFVRFLRGKQRKQMADYKVCYDPATSSPQIPPRILLALSLSESSLSLFEMLVSLLHEQRKMHRGNSGFELFAVHVDQSEVYPYPTGVDPKSVLESMRQAYNETCTTVCTPVGDFFADTRSLRHFQHDVSDIADYSFVKDLTLDGTVTVSDVLSNIRDRTSKLDILQTIRESLVLEAAKKLQCTSIVWGDTMSRLAEKTLSLTAKGRGSVIPYILSDGFRNGIYNLYPLREVLRAEAEEYVRMLNISQYVTKPSIKPPNVLRMMTIDDLLGNYFADVEKGFPSIVSTVVRTAAKLTDQVAYASDNCAICGLPCDDTSPERWLQDITVNQSAPSHDAHDEQDKVAPSKDEEKSVICYGCLVATKGVTFPWISTMRYSKEETLDEYELH
ncbi:hypothetical protein POJ06DRAFT_95119 [Lipomyces tetrasporus]|uniref:Cytoplasmic tRNA 2-thiolation protein 2 n=1 Tax=Lipomyces tetrasporus TaxID=54092 RepID=A0AAD7VU20_9ASCO|nr:uncharacterized protein POJ06DRAFT_95119 [Lipomyces tetrasporus]KAJ8101349.1 hypothetical protein POJ06DRAFT_95119 [Lipomyces tetrasporus]